jgi:hypothetical protein
MRNIIFLLLAAFSVHAFAGVNWGSHATLLDPAPLKSVTATENGATDLDLQQYSGQIIILMEAKNTAGSSPTLDVSFNDSADNSSFAAISPALAFTQMTTGASAFKLVVNKDKLRRYLRVVKTVGGTNSPAWYATVKVLAVSRTPQ